MISSALTRINELKLEAYDRNYHLKPFGTKLLNFMMDKFGFDRGAFNSYGFSFDHKRDSGNR